MHQIADAAGAVLETIVNDVQSHIKAFNKHNANAWKSFKAFLSAIDWTVRCIADEIRPSHGCDQEPWIRALLALHVTLLLLVILTRKRMAVQGVVFFASSALPAWVHSCVPPVHIQPVHIHPPAVAAVYLAEHLNSLLAAQWESFSTQPYFDKQGVFISAVYSAPLLLVMFVILVCGTLDHLRLGASIHVCIHTDQLPAGDC